MVQDPYIIEALQELGVRIPADLEAVRRAGSFAQAQARLAELKERVRLNFRKLAFELHPDRTGGDRAHTERFMRLVQAKEAFDGLKLRPVARPLASVRWVNPAPLPRVYAPTGTASAFTAYYNSTDTSANPGPSSVSPFNVVFMRPF